MTRAHVRVRSRLPLEELSGLSVRRTEEYSHGELLAVGDERFVVVTAELTPYGPQEPHPQELGRRVAPENGGVSEESEWEGIDADGEGRVFVLQESTGRIFVLSPDLDRLVHTIHLEPQGGPEAEASDLLKDPRAGPEALLLLEDGHLLVVKQRAPVRFIEFGPSAEEKPRGLLPDSYLADRRPFSVSAGDRTALRPVRSWTLPEKDEHIAKSVNDVAVDDRGELHIISSESSCIYRLEKVRPDEDRVRVTDRWLLPDELKLSDERKAEGLAFDRLGSPVVAVDAKDDEDNLFVLKKLND